MLFFKPKSHLGIDLGAGGIKIVELKLEKKRPVLYTYGLTSQMQDVHHLFDVSAKNNTSALSADQKSKSTAVTIDPEQVKKYANLLKAVCTGSRTTALSATVSLPVSVVFHAVINLPLLKKEELDRVLRAEVKKLLPRPIDDMVLDYQMIKNAPESKTQRVLVNAVPKELVVFYTQVFKLAGIGLESLEPESIALERSLIGRDQSVAMIIDIGAERTNFYIIDQGFAITHNSTEIGGGRLNKILAGVLGIKEDIVEQLKCDYFGSLLKKNNHSQMTKDKFYSLFSTIIDPIVKEIEYSFEIYLKQTGNENKRPEKIILTGGGSSMPYLADFISEKFNIKCYVGDPWGRVVYQEGLKPALGKIGPRMSVAVGLALRKLV
ncbi:MAG: pilus assembly protein PilM [Candidatus Magasanikbacteria bacterium]